MQCGVADGQRKKQLLVCIVFEKVVGVGRWKRIFDRPGAVTVCLQRSQYRCKKKESSRFLSVSLWQPRLNGGIQWKSMGVSKLPCEQLNNLFYSKESKRVYKRSLESISLHSCLLVKTEGKLVALWPGPVTWTQSAQWLLCDFQVHSVLQHLRHAKRGAGAPWWLEAKPSMEPPVKLL